MALVDCGLILYPDPWRLSGVSSLSGAVAANSLTATGHRLAHLFSAPVTASVDRLGVLVNTVTSSATVRIGLYTVDSSGNPTTTLYGGSTAATFTPLAATYHEATLGTPASMVRGDQIALVVEWDSTAGSVAFRTSSGAGAGVKWPHSSKFDGSAWTKAASLLVSSARTTGGVSLDIGTLGLTGSGTSTGTYNVNSAGADEFGLSLTLPFACRVAGVWDQFQYAATADHEAIVYSGTTPQATLTWDGDYVSASGAGTPAFRRFATPATFAAGNTVIAALRPTTTANLTWRRFSLHTAGAAAAVGLPSGAGQVTRIDQGSWSAADDTLLPLLGLILDQIDDGVSSTSPAFVRGSNTLLRM